MKVEACNYYLRMGQYLEKKVMHGLIFGNQSKKLQRTKGINTIGQDSNPEALNASWEESDITKWLYSTGLYLLVMAPLGLNIRYPVYEILKV